MDPTPLIEGQPQLTMSSINTLEDLAPFFASICDNVTRQQTKSHSKANSESLQPVGQKSAMAVINAIIEKDFLENRLQ